MLQFFIGEPVPVSWNELVNPLTKAAETGATITGSLAAADGTAIQDSTFSLDYVETITGKGAVYRGLSPIMAEHGSGDAADVGLAVGGEYFLILEAIKSAARIGYRKIPVVAVYQEAV